MSNESPVREQLVEIGETVDQLLEVINTARNVFVHQRGQLLVELNNQQDPHSRKIASAILRMNEPAEVKSGEEGGAYVRLHSILAHILMITETLSDAILNDNMESRQRAVDDSNNLAQSCLQFATDHENRMVEVLCILQVAPLFLAILDQIQTLLHHEWGIAKPI